MREDLFTEVKADAAAVPAEPAAAAAAVDLAEAVTAALEAGRPKIDRRRVKTGAVWKRLYIHTVPVFY